MSFWGSGILYNLKAKLLRFECAQAKSGDPFYMPLLWGFFCDFNTILVAGKKSTPTCNALETKETYFGENPNRFFEDTPIFPDLVFVHRVFFYPIAGGWWPCVVFSLGCGVVVCVVWSGVLCWCARDTLRWSHCLAWTCIATAVLRADFVSSASWIWRSGCSSLGLNSLSSWPSVLCV